MRITNESPNRKARWPPELNVPVISKLAFYFLTFQGFSAFSGFHKKSKVRK
jgi:hypothetical protein